MKHTPKILMEEFGAVMDKFDDLPRMSIAQLKDLGYHLGDRGLCVKLWAGEEEKKSKEMTLIVREVLREDNRQASFCHMGKEKDETGVILDKSFSHFHNMVE